MDSRRATVRNMRSKCRCSCVLQFTFRRAVSCVLHRPPSQVIHCTVLFLFRACPSRGERNTKIREPTVTSVSDIPSRGRAHKNKNSGKAAPHLGAMAPSGDTLSHEHGPDQVPEPPAQAERASTARPPGPMWRHTGQAGPGPKADRPRPPSSRERRGTEGNAATRESASDLRTRRRESR